MIRVRKVHRNSRVVASDSEPRNIVADGREPSLWVTFDSTSKKTSCDTSGVSRHLPTAIKCT
eukprot:scaffold1875_cov146-Skeletonema_dohrnii-CCMP3373.AAC.3